MNQPAGRATELVVCLIAVPGYPKGAEEEAGDKNGWKRLYGQMQPGLQRRRTLTLNVPSRPSIPSLQSPP